MAKFFCGNSESFLIRSASRDASSVSSSDCKIFLRQPIDLISTKIKLDYLKIYNTIYNINSLNNKFYFNDGAPKNFTIPNGFYSSLSLGAELQSDLNNISANWTVNYNTTTGKFTFSNTGAFTLLFLTGGSNSCFRECGYISTNGLTAVDSASSVTSSTAPYLANLTYPSAIYFTISEFGTQILTSDNFQMTFYIPNAVGSENVIEYKSAEFFDQDFCLTNRHVIQQLSIRLTDDQNRTLDLNNSDWEAVLSFIKDEDDDKKCCC